MAATFPTQIDVFDPIELDAARAREHEAIHVDQRDHPAWPNGTLTIQLDYNNSQAQWNFRIQIDGHGTIIPRQPAEYVRVYTYREYLAFIFADLAGETDSIDPSTLGAEVDLYAVPGPESPGYEAWLKRQSEGSDVGN